MGWFDKSSRTSTNTTNNYVDSRSVVDASGGGIVGTGNSVNYNSTDAVRLIADVGLTTVKDVAMVARDMTATAGQNSLTAWEHTLDRSGDTLDKLLMTTQRSTDGAQALAGAMLAAATPSDGKNADTIKYALIALAVVGGGALMMRKG
jgi:hypothetical protein